MTAELKAKWIAALLSGEYPQGRLRLNREGRFCCLGVLCEVGGLPKGQIDHNGAIPYLDSQGHWEAVAIKASQFDLQPATVMTLIKLNDSNRASFAEIAAYIEANVDVDDGELECQP